MSVEDVRAALDKAIVVKAGVVMPPREPHGANAAHGEPSHEGARESRREDSRDTGEIGDADDATAEIGPSGADENALYDGRVSQEVVQGCAGLDHSDTDNGTRLLRHFGADLRVMRLADAKSPSYVGWTGTHWDPDNGTLLSHAVAQQVGDVIGLEAEFLALTPFEAQIVREADIAGVELARLQKKTEPTDSERAQMRQLDREVQAGQACHDALERRQVARRKFAVSSKNKSRIEAMLVCAAPHCAVDPDDFNADAFVLPTRAHTLRFAPDGPAAAGLRPYRLDVREGHERTDMATRLVPVTYRAGAEAPRWRAFLEEMLPNPEVRDFVQTYSGIGLLGRTVQMIIFHYGSGANGKSVYLETIMRVLGALGVGLPAESVTGAGDRASGGASPDLARLYGARTVRILELPDGKPLHEDLIKKLTGGEKIPVRTLFKGYFEFTPVFTAHMSGNGYPRIDGTDNGIWRRLKVVHWPIELPPERQRPFDDMLADFAPEYPGILNWLIDGAMVYLERGLQVPQAIATATDEYRSAMDPIRDFVADCVEILKTEAGEADEAYGVSAREMYRAYQDWCGANAMKPFTETRFGLVMKKKVKRIDDRVRRYVGCRLHDVPHAPSDRWSHDDPR